MVTSPFGIALLTVMFMGTSAQTSQNDMATRIQAGSVSERRETVAEALRIPPDRRSLVLTRALADELTRVNALIKQRQDQPGAGEPEWREVPLGEYLGSLIEANAQSADPQVISPLMGAIGTGRMASSAVARFGSIALPQVLRVFSNSSEDRMDRLGAANAMQDMLVQNRLSEIERRRIVEATGLSLSRREHYVVVAAALDLAVKTGDPELIRTVERIAEDPSVAQISGDDPLNRANIANWARRALSTRAKQE